MPVEVYSQEGNAQFEAELAARTAERDAAFVRPHLRPGMRLLDAGCGPGSITLGLAELVAPGETVGIDLQPALVERARATATARAIGTVGFQTADIYQLPFPDGSFDVAYANGLVMHLREPIRALGELRRVLRPGGLAALRDPDWGSALYAPTTPTLEHWLELRTRVRRHNGGDPFASRHYRRWLLEAGFARAEASASLRCAGAPPQLLEHARFLKAQIPGFVRTAVELGWIDRDAVEGIAEEIDAWAARPDAFHAATWCEAIGWT